MWKQTRSRWFASQAGQASGPGCVPLNRDWVEAAADIAVTASGGHRTGAACPPKQTGREETVRLIALHNRHRAGLPVAPPSITHQARSATLRAPRCWIFDTPTNSVIPDAAGDPGSRKPDQRCHPGAA